MRTDWRAGREEDGRKPWIYDPPAPEILAPSGEDPPADSPARRQSADGQLSSPPPMKTRGARPRPPISASACARSAGAGTRGGASMIGSKLPAAPGHGPAASSVCVRGHAPRPPQPPRSSSQAVLLLAPSHHLVALQAVTQGSRATGAARFIGTAAAEGSPDLMRQTTEAASLTSTARRRIEARGAQTASFRVAGGKAGARRVATTLEEARVTARHDTAQVGRGAAAANLSHRRRRDGGTSPRHRRRRRNDVDTQR